MTTDSRVGSTPLRSSSNGSTPTSTPVGPRRRPARSSTRTSNNSAGLLGDEARRYAAELIGTALLVVIGVGVAVLAPGAGPIGIALAFGLVLSVLVYTLGPVSGCHLNPAVTLGMLLTGRIAARQALGHVVAQIIGGIAGAAVVLAVANSRPDYSRARDGLGTNGWGAHSSGGYGFTAAAIVEVLLTALLVLTVLRVTADKQTAQVAGLPIGLALLVAHLVAVPIDGTSVNPARSIGPALLSGGPAMSQLWLFIVAPLIGAVLAVAGHRALTLRGDTATAAKDTASARKNGSAAVSVESTVRLPAGGSAPRPADADEKAHSPEPATRPSAGQGSPKRKSRKRR